MKKGRRKILVSGQGIESGGGSYRRNRRKEKSEWRKGERDPVGLEMGIMYDQRGYKE